MLFICSIELGTSKTHTAMNASKIMKQAHNIARMTRKSFASYRLALASGLKKAHKLHKPCITAKVECPLKLKAIIAETEQAVLVNVTVKISHYSNASYEMWVPKSQVQEGHVSEWFASKERIIAVL